MKRLSPELLRERRAKLTRSGFLKLIPTVLVFLLVARPSRLFAQECLAQSETFQEPI